MESLEMPPNCPKKRQGIPRIFRALWLVAADEVRKAATATAQSAA
jgi:hypothetical protein